MELRTIMAYKPITVGPHETVPRAAAKMRDANVGCLVVTTGGTVVGIVTDRDLVVRCLGATSEDHNPAECAVSAHMTQPVVTAGPEADVLEAAHLMTQQKVKRLPVVHGSDVIGLVSMSDIAEALERPVHDLLVGMGSARNYRIVTTRR
jgi:CBS domain-containing protein